MGCEKRTHKLKLIHKTEKKIVTRLESFPCNGISSAVTSLLTVTAGNGEGLS